ncbi:hypothetical protein EDB19DRAFT_88855 [Suillus lakei]|nr:hypothetical protein EDB19DRAFT_88855 [Suillus lakei]
MVMFTPRVLERDCFCGCFPDTVTRKITMEQRVQSSKVSGGISLWGAACKIQPGPRRTRRGSCRFGIGNTQRYLIGKILFESDTAFDFCFLGNDRLLVITDDLKLYSIEDMSQTPQLLACVLMPVSLTLRCLLPMDDMQVHQTMYTSDPTRRLLCLTTYSTRATFLSSTQVFIISTRIFFDLDGMAAATPIAWKHWGPSNTRIFRHPYHFNIHVSGNRVLQALPVGTRNSEHILHLMDFSPLAVTNRRGLGRVVKEPSMIDVVDSIGRSGGSLTTSLPYVEVVFSDRKFSSADSVLEDIWMDRDRIYVLNADLERAIFVVDPIHIMQPTGKLEVIDI